MLRTPARALGGFSLIELLVTMSLISILMVIAVPAFGKWSADAHVRAAAESLINALRLTQATAVSQGRTSIFALTTDSQPSLSSSAVSPAANWLAVLNPMLGNDVQTPVLVLKSTEGTQHGVTITGPALTCFNSVGRQVALTPTVAPLSAGTCSLPASDPAVYTVTRTSASRSFKVLVYIGGRVRLCDASKTLSSTNPDGCP